MSANEQTSISKLLHTSSTHEHNENTHVTCHNGIMKMHLHSENNFIFEAAAINRGQLKLNFSNF